MLYVSLLIEILRTRPRLIFWLAALTQAFLWIMVPALFYSAPPGNVADVLAVGQDFRFGSELGPPLAFWLAEIAFRLAGNHLVGVYVLSQVCVVVTYWAVFTLGRATVGERHAALAVLLMAGISAFTISTPDFGPDILAMPLWAFAMLFLWRAVGELRGLYWHALTITLGLLLLTTHLALILIGVMVVFVLATERGRTALSSMESWVTAVIVTFMTFPNLILLDLAGESVMPTLARLRSIEAMDKNLLAWGHLVGLLVVSHAGIGVLLLLASNLTRTRRGDAAIILRPPIDPFARTMIYYFALAPAGVMTVFTVIAGYTALPGTGVLVVMSGLAVVVAAGDAIMLHRQRALGVAWFAVLLLPPVAAGMAVILLPWTLAIDLKVAQPATEIGNFFTDNFERRTGQRLSVVAGDTRLASLVAVSSPSRPRLFTDEPGRPQIATRKDIAEKGAIVLWPATDSAGTPPPDIKTRFPDLVTEVPRAFERPVQGRLPLLRIGWGMIRPQAQATPQTPGEPAKTQ